MPKIPPNQFQFCGPSYVTASPVIDCQRSINIYPEKGWPSSKTGYGLIGRPGTSAFANNPAGGGAGHSQGLWAGNGRLFAAIAGHVYELSNLGAVITDYGAGLNVGTPSPVYFQQNGQQLMCCDALLRNIFLVNTVGPALTLEFRGVALDYLDGYFVAIATDASLVGTNPNQISASAFLDGTNWLPGAGATPAYALRTGASDLTIQLATLNSLLWIFGQKTTEIWYNAGLSPFPFARINGGALNVGCLAAGSVVKFNNTILWLGGDGTGYGQVYQAVGTGFKRVSTPGIEAVIAAYGSQPDLPYATAFGYQEAGHSFYCLRICNSSYQAAKMLVYDLTEQMWHERTYGAGFSVRYPCAFASVPNFGASIPNFVLRQDGKVQYQSIAYASDDGTAITYTRTAPHLSRMNEWMTHRRFELDCDIGTAAPILTYSNDGGRNFGTQNRALAQAAPQGDPASAPEGQRFFAEQLGRSRDRVYSVSITDSTNLIRIANAYVDAGPDDEEQEAA